LCRRAITLGLWLLCWMSIMSFVPKDFHTCCFCRIFLADHGLGFGPAFIYELVWTGFTAAEHIFAIVGSTAVDMSVSRYALHIVHTCS
jgi:hypothetical protein